MIENFCTTRIDRFIDKAHRQGKSRKEIIEMLADEFQHVGYPVIEHRVRKVLKKKVKKR